MNTVKINLQESQDDFAKEVMIISAYKCRLLNQEDGSFEVNGHWVEVRKEESSAVLYSGNTRYDLEIHERIIKSYRVTIL